MFLDFRGSWKARRKPKQTQGEHINLQSFMALVHLKENSNHHHFHASLLTCHQTRFYFVLYINILVRTTTV